MTFLFNSWARGIDEHTVVVIRKYFGPYAMIEKRWSGWIRVTISGGWQVAFKPGEGLSDIIGGAEMYRAALLMSDELWGCAKVSGSHEQILASIAHGKELGVRVLPVVEQEPSAPIAFAFGALVFCFTLLIGMFFLGFGELFEAAFLLAIASAAIADPFIEKLLAKDALRAAQKYMDVFPDLYGSERKADREVARRRGLL
jgi:hypothetical protein